jgi:predicted nucleotidyltransferase component of viral defense system
MAFTQNEKKDMNNAIEKMLQRYKISNRGDAERALREILQEITLVALWRGKFFEHAAFYGGTALRILYGLDRFSEHLDFTLIDGKQFEWKLFERNVVEELSSYGFEVKFTEKIKQNESAVRSALLKTNTEHALFQINVREMFPSGIHPDAIIKIKVEIDTSPILGFNVEPIYLKEPLPVSIMVLDESSLFAGKTNAALYRAWKKRVKGRDWYDLVWFLRRNIPINQRYLEACMRDNGDLSDGELLTELKVQTLLKKRVEEINLEHAKEDVHPFLRDPGQLDLWSVEFFHHWIGQLKFMSEF